MSLTNENMGITRDSEKLICYLYRSFLKRRNDGVPKNSAREFNEVLLRSNKKLSKWTDADIAEFLEELASHNYIKKNILGEITLTDSLIVYMERRFSRGLSDVWHIITDLL